MGGGVGWEGGDGVLLHLELLERVRVLGVLEQKKKGKCETCVCWSLLSAAE